MTREKRLIAKTVRWLTGQFLVMKKAGDFQSNYAAYIREALAMAIAFQTATGASCMAGDFTIRPIMCGKFNASKIMIPCQRRSLRSLQVRQGFR